MRENFGVKPWTYPQPVFIIGSYDENGNADAMNAAWCGISNANQIAMCLSAGHKTVKNILIKKDFTVSMATVKIDPDKLNPITFDSVNNTYVKLGEVVGNAFEDGKRFM